MGVPVLVVDDDHTLRMTLHMVFEDDGYQVFEAPDSRPALERLDEYRGGMVVLLDLYMPGMDGQQLLEAVAQREDLMGCHAFILVTAGLIRPFSMAFARLLTRLNVQMLSKPFDLDVLLSAVRDAQERLAHGGASGAGESRPARSACPIVVAGSAERRQTA